MPPKSCYNGWCPGESFYPSPSAGRKRARNASILASSLTLHPNYHSEWSRLSRRRFTAKSRALTHGFLRITSCQNTLIRYTDLDARIRFNVVRTLTYEKYTIVLYQPVSRCLPLRYNKHLSIRGTTYAHS